jgi:hypothetical protein
MVIELALSSSDCFMIKSPELSLYSPRSRRSSQIPADMNVLGFREFHRLSPNNAPLALSQDNGHLLQPANAF